MKSTGQFFVNGVLLAALGLGIALWLHSRSEARDQIAALQERVEHLSAENERLVHSARQPPQDDAAAELARLRAEVVKLRSEVRNPVPKTASHPPASSTPSVPERSESPAANPSPSIPKDSWAYAGYDTPAAALQSVLWAMKNGDVASLLLSLTPDTEKKAIAEFTGKTPEQMRTELMSSVEGIQGFQPDRIRAESDTAFSYAASSKEEFNGNTTTHDEAVLHFQKVDGQWKMHFD